MFSADTVAVEPIREDQEYGGRRVKLERGPGKPGSISRLTSASAT